MLCADAYIVSRSPRGWERIMGGLRRIVWCIWSDDLREQNADHVHADSACIGNADCLQRHGAQCRLTTPFTCLAGAVAAIPNLGRDRPADPRGVDEIQALHSGAVRPPEGKFAT